MACRNLLRKMNLGFSGFGGYSARSCSTFDASNACAPMRLGITEFRRYSTRRWDAPDTCIIRGVDHDIPFPGSLLESLTDHDDAFPLVTKVPGDKLFVLQSTRPHEITDHWRQIFHSAFLQSCFCKSQKDCVANMFDYNNIGVIKGFNILGFKRLDRVEGQTNSDHSGYISFVEDTLNRFCGPNALKQFPECQDFLAACNDGWDDDILRHHSFFLDDEELAELYTDIHRLVRHQFGHRGLGKEARMILAELHGSFDNSDVVYFCSRHKLLASLLGSHCPVRREKASHDGIILIPPHRGSAIVDVHRIAVQHAIEDQVLEPARDKYPEQKDLWKKYTRVDLIKALRYGYGTYPGKALAAFKNAGVIDHLGLHRRLRLENLYNYAPLSDNKECSQGDMTMREMPTNCVNIDTDAYTVEWLKARDVVLPSDQFDQTSSSFEYLE